MVRHNDDFDSYKYAPHLTIHHENLDYSEYLFRYILAFAIPSCKVTDDIFINYLNSTSLRISCTLEQTSANTIIKFTDSSYTNPLVCNSLPNITLLTIVHSNTNDSSINSLGKKSKTGLDNNYICKLVYLYFVHFMALD